MAKFDKMVRFVPSLYKPSVNPMVRGLLVTWAGEDDKIVAAVADAKEQLFVRTAQLQFLDALGSNVGVFRPTAFNLSDELFRQLIPALSFAPKQVIPTIKKVLDVFFGVGNPRVQVHEIRPNQIEIQIPSTVPALRRSLRGSHHFHAYAGTITTIDDTLKEMTIALDSASKVLLVDELAGALFGQGLEVETIVSNAAGTTGVLLQFAAGADLSSFVVSGRFNCARPAYEGSFVPDTTAAFTTTRSRGTLGQTISVGQIVPTLTMLDASGIPNAPGYLTFNFGRSNEEPLIKYFGRPNNTTIFLDPVYVFQKAHVSGEVVNVVVTPYSVPRTDGRDFSIYLVGITAARILAQQIVESITAAGVVINWTIVEPLIDC